MLKSIKVFLYLGLLLSSSSFAKQVTLNDLVNKVQHSEIEIELTAPKPFINKFQLRIDDKNEFKKGDIDFEFRLYADNLNEYRQKKKLYQNQKQRKKIIQKISLGDKLNNIINLYISLNLGRKKYDILQELESVNKDKVNVYRKLVRKGVAKATDYIKAIDNYEMSQVELKKQLTENQSLVASINGMLASNYKITDFSRNEKLVSLSYIQNKMKNEESRGDGLGVKLAKFQEERIDLESALKNEDDHKILDFVAIGINGNQMPHAAEYDSDKSDHRLTIKLALNLPFFGSNMDRADNTMDSFLKKRKAKVEYVESIASFTNLKGTVEMLLQGVAKLEKSRSVKEARKYLKIYSKRKGTDPLKLLGLNEFLIDADLKLNEYKSELYIHFYKYMFEIGKLDFENGKLILKG